MWSSARADIIIGIWFVAGRKLLGVQRLFRTTTPIEEIGIIGQIPLVEINIWWNRDHCYVYTWTKNVMVRTFSPYRRPK